VKSLLLTGGCGFIGSHLARWVLRNRDWRVTILDRLDSAGAQSRIADLFRDYPDRVSLVHHDLRAAVSDAVAIEILTGGHKWPLARFDYVAHLAAGSHVNRSIVDPQGFLLDNVVGTGNLLDFLRLHAALADGGKCLYFSTDEVFGPAADGVAFRPWDRHAPLNPYAASKSGGELLAVSYAETYGMPIAVTHGTNFFGEDQDREKFIPIAIERLLAGQSVPVHVVGDRVCSRYYTHAENAASAVVSVLESGTTLDGSNEAGRFNISGTDELANDDVVGRIAKLLGLASGVEYVSNPPGRLRPDLRYCVTGDELAALGWAPSVSFDEGLRRTVESYAPKMARAAE
jgi:dTDP-glucose 4,6-dehydratase